MLSILCDIVEPKAPKGVNNAQFVCLKADLSEPSSLDAIFSTPLGKPDVAYLMHGIMSLGSEENWDLGMKINMDSVRSVLEKARHSRNEAGEAIRVVFTSSVASYGGDLPDVVTTETACFPEGAYGCGKLIGEYLVTEYTRRGFVNGISVKLPTIVPRPGAPSRATSAFVSGIVREPLNGQEAICPVGSSASDPVLNDVGVWVAKPSTTLTNLAMAKDIVADPVLSKKMLRWTRSVMLPGFTVNISQIIEALRNVRGDQAVDLIKFEHDETCARIVKSWPRAFETKYPLSLGFKIDEDGFEGAIKEYMASYA